jgi:signal transduction histidine kinase
LSRDELSRALDFQSRRAMEDLSPVDETPRWIIEAARKKYNARGGFSIGRILTELSLVSAGMLVEALETQLMSAARAPENRLEALELILAKLRGSANLLTLINHILVLSLELVDAEEAALFIGGRGGGSMAILRPTGRTAEELTSVETSLERGVAGWVCRTSTPVFSNNASMDPRFDGGVDATEGRGVAGLMCVPLAVPDGGLGALGVAKKAGGFLPEDIFLLKAFASQAAAALECARLRIREAESRRREARAALMISDAMLHEMKKTMCPLQGYAKRLQERASDERVEKYCSIVDRTLTRLVSRVEDMVRYFNGGFPLIRDTLDLSELLGELESRSWAECRLSGVALRLDAQKGIRVHADRELLLNCLLYLVQNGREAMPAGGELSVDARESRDMVTIRVSDDGPGVPAGDLQTVFDPFYSNGKAHKAGLGLSIARAIVEAHGGVIRAESTPHGASFAITIPSA